MASSYTELPASAVLTCYLVEDSAIIRENLIATLEEMVMVRVIGYAETEQSAVEWIEGPAPDCKLMIIDIFLAFGSGLEVIRCAHRLRPATKLVVLTNYATAEIRQRCLQLGADKVFDKSAELEDLLAYCGGLATA